MPFFAILLECPTIPVVCLFAHDVKFEMNANVGNLKIYMPCHLYRLFDRFPRHFLSNVMMQSILFYSTWCAKHKEQVCQ